MSKARVHVDPIVDGGPGPADLLKRVGPERREQSSRPPGFEHARRLLEHRLRPAPRQQQIRNTSSATPTRSGSRSASPPISAIDATLAARCARAAEHRRGSNPPRARAPRDTARRALERAAPRRAPDSTATRGSRRTNVKRSSSRRARLVVHDPRRVERAAGAIERAARGARLRQRKLGAHGSRPSRQRSCAAHPLTTAARACLPLRRQTETREQRLIGRACPDCRS